MSGWPRAALVASACSLAPAAALACPDPGMLAPVDAGIREYGIDGASGACGAPSLYATTRAFALIDADNFHGTIDASLATGVRLAIDDGVTGSYEVEIGVQVVDWRFAQTAVITASELSAGPIYGGVVAPLLRRADLRVALVSRIALQTTDLGYRRGGVTTLAGVAMTWAARDDLALHARVAGVTDLERAAVPASFDLAFAPTRWLALAAGAEAQTGWYGDPLDHVLVRGAIRLRAGPQRIELGLAAPLLGAERATGVVQLGWAHSL